MWTVAVFLAIILIALFNQYVSRNDAIVKSQLMRSMRQVSMNLELEMNSLSGALQSIVSNLEKDNFDSGSFGVLSEELLQKFPEVDLIRVVLPTGKAIDTKLNPRIDKDVHIRKFNYLEYPQNLREALAEAFNGNRLIISSYWSQPQEITNQFVAVIAPFKEKNGATLALLVRVSLNRLLQQAIPMDSPGDFEYSLIHGTQVIAGMGAFNSERDPSIPSVVMPAYPLPATIQVYGSQIIKTPLILSDPLLLWSSLLFLVLFISVVYVSRSLTLLRNKLKNATEKNNLFMEIESSLTFGVVVTDMDYRIMFANEAMENLTGYTNQELVHRTQPWAFLGGVTLPTVSINRISNTSIFPIRLDRKIIKKNEKEIACSILLSPFYNLQNDQEGWLLVFRDNTPEANAQYLINDALATYQKLLNSVTACISVVHHSPSGSVLGIRNSPYTEQLGHTIDGHIHISKAFTIPFNPEGVRSELVWVEDLGRWFQANEIRMTLSGGALVTMQTALDVTTSKIAEDSLEKQARKMEASSRLISLGEMASTVTHEINQPLTAISTYSSMALEIIKANPEGVTLEKVIEVFTKINTQSKRIEKIIKNIRNFSQKKRASMSIVGVSVLVNDTVELAQLVEKRNKVKIIYEVERDLPNVECDPLQIVQVLLNLIRNAADALFEHKSLDNRIWFRIHRLPEENYLRFEVCDHGIGIPDSIKSSLFTPFFTTKKEGLGLGLSICRSIIESHSSRLRVEDNEGGGAKFFFDLKIAEEPKDE